MILGVLTNRNFRHYFIADVISGFGTGMSFIGANWFILELTGKSSSVGLLLAVTLLSGLVVFPFAGTIADKFSRKKVIIWSNAVRAIAIAAMAALYYTGRFNTGYLYFLAVVGGVGWTIFIPASRGMVQELLEKGDLIKGNSLIEISMQVGMFTAAAVAGIVYKFWGFGAIMVIDAVTFLVSNISLVGINYDRIMAHDHEESFRVQFSNGLRYLKSNAAVFVFGIVAFIPFAATMASNVVLPGYVSEHLGRDSVVFGLADMSYGIGACLSGFIAAAVAAKITKHRAIVAFFVVSTAACVYLVFNAQVAGLYAASLVFGLCNSSLRIVMNTILMEEVPKAYFGRAMSVWMACSMFMQAAVSYGIGALMDVFYVTMGFLWISIVMIVGFVSFGFLAGRMPKPIEVAVVEGDGSP